LLYALEILPLSNSDTFMINHGIDRAVYKKKFHSADAGDIQYKC